MAQPLNEIDKYMVKVTELLDKTTDPFAAKYRKELLSEIKVIASKNWVQNGEPTLDPEQMRQAYINVQNKSADKSWAIVGGYNIAMN
jgi:hypothetical protein